MTSPWFTTPLSTLMLAGIREILIISTPQDAPKVLNNCWVIGSRFGLSLHSTCRSRVPKGIAQAFLVGQKFIGSSCCALVLGDNIFYGHDLAKTVLHAGQQRAGARGVRVSGAGSRNVTE